MISTVTTTTVTTVTTVAALGLGGSFALVSVLLLVALLIQKDLTIMTITSRAKKLDKALVIAIVPLLIAFAFIVVYKVAEVWR